MADGSYTGPVESIDTDQDAYAADFLPLDDSDSSDAQISPDKAEHGDDSASDVSIELDTDDEDAANSPASQPQAGQLGAATAPSAPLLRGTPDKLDGIVNRKRKSSGDAPVHQNDANNLDTVKKVKLAQSKGQTQSGDNRSIDRSRTIPSQIWCHIFTFCPPRTLGKLLQVNRLFNLYLDSSSSIQRERPDSLSGGVLSVLEPNSIWQASRRRFWPGMPSPLQDKTELYMWQLCGSSTCQYCGLRPGVRQQTDPPEPWQSGPGKTGVTIIWAFAIRSCGACLLSKTTKVCSAPLDGRNRALVLTQCQAFDLLMMPSVPSELAAALPFVFLTQDLHAISPAAMERGQPPAVGPLQKLHWSAHVEDLKQEFLEVRVMGSATAEEWLKGLDGRGSERRIDASRWENWGTASGGLSQMRNVLYPGHRPPAPASLPTRTTSVVHIPGLSSTHTSSRAATPSAGSSQRNGVSPVPFRRSSSGTVSHSTSRPHEKTKEEVAELKAARKAEIERRALALDPPLPANILAHIPVFQAALQIYTPMNEQGWEQLKPRLLAQRAEAEQRGKESAARKKQELDEKRNQNAATKETRDTEDVDWDDVQAPLRARIAGFADEIIRDGWDDGEKVGRDNCSTFAVEVLVYIRKRFYAEVAKDAAAARAAGKPPNVDPLQGPFTQKLTLENMKWIFEVKVKPHTEQYRKEIFLCNGCEVTVRYYGFEGVIQHYAAKHTNALSIGNVVVHWRAEWPEHPPFTSEQKTAKTGFHQAQPAAAYNTYQTGPPSSYQPTSVGPAPAYGGSSWNEPYSQGSHAAPPAAVGGYAPPQGFGASAYPPAEPYQPYPPTPAQQQSYGGLPQAAPAPPYNYNYGAYQSNGQVGFQSIQPAPFPGHYGTQLEDVAQISRELWNATSNMKDTLSIVRVQVVIYHLAKRFHARFGVPLPLSTFIDGLSNHKDMRPVRNVNGLICRVCHQGTGGYVASEEERKSWSLPQLTSHFQSKHVEPFVQMGQFGQPPEWTIEMVLLPEPAAVSNLRASISTDGHKYQLVSEAVPHLLALPDAAQPAASETSNWQVQSGHSGMYQAPPAGASAQYFEESHTGDATQEGSEVQYPKAARHVHQYSQDSVGAYNQTEPLAAVAMSIPLGGTYNPPESVTAAQAVPLSRTDDSGNGLSQGWRQRQKKNKKKGGNDRDCNDEQARKRKEEEEKMAEEEAERETDVIRAMWAADRANTAKKSVAPESDKAENLRQAKKPSPSPNPSSKANTPQQRHRFQSRPPRNSPLRAERTSPPRVLNSRPNRASPAQHDTASRGHQLSNVAYMTSGLEKPPRGDWRPMPDRYDRHEQPPPLNAHRPRSRSPVYAEYEQPLPVEHYRQRSPPRHPAGPVHQPRPPVSMDDVRSYEREPPPRDDYGPRGYPAPGPPPALASTGELIEYEVTEYRDPDGTVWIEERPIRRIPNQEAERYYHDAPPPAPVAAYDRSDPLPPPPAYYRRDQPLPPPHTAEHHQYHQPYGGGYSRAPPPQGARPPEFYNPRYPSEAVSRRNEPPPPREEYDPRYPAGPPNVPASAPRAARYP